MPQHNVSLSQWYSISLHYSSFSPLHPTLDQGAILNMPVSVSRKPNEMAGIVSPVINPTGGNCLIFWYRLYGPENDGLQVYAIKAGGSKTLLWKRQGTSGSEWRRAIVETPAQDTSSYQVRSGLCIIRIYVH